MRVIETTAHIGADGMLRLEVPLEQRNEDVRVKMVVESTMSAGESANSDRPAPNDPWAPYRSRLESAGMRVAAPGSWSARRADPLQFDGPSVSQSLVEDRR